MNFEENKKLLDDLYFDYHRMSPSGKETLDYIQTTKMFTCSLWSITLVKKLIGDLYEEFDRLSKGGQEALDDLADRFGA